MSGQKKNEKILVIFTIGHSTRTLDTFISLLQGHEVTRLVDVRTIPRSRHNPQFNQETLPDALKEVGVTYTHLAGLGGLRHPRDDSPNQGWHNLSFRGFADYMQTPEFNNHLDQLISLARHDLLVVMCAEAVPWRCHRSLIADALLVRGMEPREIVNTKDSVIHTLTPWARVEGSRIIYPLEAAEQFEQEKIRRSPLI